MKKRTRIGLCSIVMLLSLVGSLCRPVAANDSDAKAKNESAPAPAPAPAGQSKFHKGKLEILTKAQLDALLRKRLQGGLGYKLPQFANMFMVTSRMFLDTSVGLTYADKKIGEYPLEPAFPSTYKPTLRELLDAIAFQTGSSWAYEEKDQFVNSSVPDNKPISGIVIISFKPAKNDIPFEMQPPKDWLAYDKTNWTMYVPPIAPVAIDLHVCGQLSSDDKTKQEKLFDSAPRDFALDFLHNVKKDATERDLKKSKVGDHDAYFFETQLPPTGEEKYRWRQWHFMVGNRLCYVISTIRPEQENELYPGVLEMLKTFRPATP